MKERFEAFESSPVLQAIFWGCFVAIVAALDAWRYGHEPHVIALLAMGWGAIFALLGARYPKLRREMKENMPKRRKR